MSAGRAMLDDGLQSDACGTLRVLFGARCPSELDPGEQLHALGVEQPAAWNRQIHSERVVEAVVGSHHQADGLYTAAAGLALAVLSADCVPVLLGGERAIAALHAGWRGLEAGILERGVAALRRIDPEAVHAWIGPAIGPCCYEVGWDVAQRVARRSGGEVIQPSPRPGSERPHLDLGAAARLELERLGVAEIRSLRRCTYCSDQGGWASYRREGARAGRNVSYIWRVG